MPNLPLRQVRRPALGGSQLIRGRDAVLWLACLALAAAWSAREGPPALVMLFATRMDKDCVRDAARLLERTGIPHVVLPSEDGFRLQPHNQTRARVLLAEAGLPRHGVFGREPRCDGGPSPELRRFWRQGAVEEMQTALGLLPGVKSAVVSSSPLEKSVFAERQPLYVQVHLQSDWWTTGRHCDAIRRLVLTLAAERGYWNELELGIFLPDHLGRPIRVHKSLFQVESGWQAY